LQNAGRNSPRLLYCVFDLLYLDGKDLRGKTLLQRKAELAKILPKSPLLLYSAHVIGEGVKAFKRAEQAHEEGVIAKLASGRYHSGERTREWLKVKASQEQEAVIVGFTAPRRSRKYFGALLFAVREGESWKYAGRAGTGFDTEMLRSVHEKLVPLITDKKPIAEKVPDLSRTTLGQAQVRRRGEVHRMDGGGRDAPPGISGLAHRQKGDRGRPRGSQATARGKARTSHLKAG
jgi:bifunctional non-homologous end joining protein LigD